MSTYIPLHLHVSACACKGKQQANNLIRCFIISFPSHQDLDQDQDSDLDQDQDLDSDLDQGLDQDQDLDLDQAPDPDLDQDLDLDPDLDLTIFCLFPLGIVLSL